MTSTKCEGVGVAGSAEATTGTAEIQGFEQAVADEEAAKNWRSFSDRKIRVGIAGYGVCGFGAAFHFQDHPNVTVAAVADLDPDKCAELAKRCRCETVDADLLFEAVKTSGRQYMMFEASYFHDDLYCMREMYRAGIVAHQSALKDGELMKIPQYIL